MENTYTCPCCGYNQLDVNPYKNMPENPHPITVDPPYEDHWGMASYEVCSCCGFEYGNDDMPMDEENKMSFKEYLREWVKGEDAKWFEPEKRPSSWDLSRQLTAAGIEVPDYIKAQRQLSSS